MPALINHEGIGHELATECLNAILSSNGQALHCRCVLDLLDSVSGDNEVAKASRRGAAIALVNVIERGLDAIRKEASQ